MVDRASARRLGYSDAAQAVAVPEETTVGEARKLASTEWLIVTKEDGVPISALRRSALRRRDPDRKLGDLAHLATPTVVASAATPRAKLTSSWLRREMRPTSPVVAVEPNGAMSVMVGRDNTEPHVETLGDQELPGFVTILSKRCRYREGRRQCSGICQFQSRPPIMPTCSNPSALAAHLFVW